MLRQVFTGPLEGGPPYTGNSSPARFLAGNFAGMSVFITLAHVDG